MTQINVDAYLVDCLLPDLVGHDRRLSSFIVYLYLYRHASRDANWSVRKSHQSIATATGLSRSAAQTALAHLQTRELIATSWLAYGRACPPRASTLVAPQQSEQLTDLRAGLEEWVPVFSTACDHWIFTLSTNSPTTCFASWSTLSTLSRMVSFQSTPE